MVTFSIPLTQEHDPVKELSKFGSVQVEKLLPHLGLVIVLHSELFQQTFLAVKSEGYVVIMDVSGQYVSGTLVYNWSVNCYHNGIISTVKRIII